MPHSARSYADWLQSASQALAVLRPQNPYIQPEREANLLLQRATGKNRAQIFAFSETLLSAEQEAQLADWLNARLTGKPIAYILGEREFWSLPLRVSEATLIPRPDTECLVERALAFVADKPQARILDLGTGTGAIALALASELAQAEIEGVDRLDEAVALARANAETLGLNVKFYRSHWFSAVTRRFDLIVSNPPYIDEADENLAVGDVRFEPLSALVAEDHGLADFREIIANAPCFLVPEGALLLEHGYQQGEAVRALFDTLIWTNIETLPDYAGLDRITFAQLRA